MNSYRLLLPDCEPSDVWACGQCGRAHIAVIGTGPSASDSNRERAEACCVPRQCGFCGKPTERNAIGDYPPHHDTCLASVLQPDLSHRSMVDPWARLLYRRMSEISEKCYAAGWLLGNEFMLWRALNHGSSAYGRGELSAEELEELQVLAERANGWIWTGPVDDHLPRLVSFSEWAQHVAAAAGESES